jgi:hypothetical protein
MHLWVERVRVNTGVDHRSLFMKASNRLPDLSTTHDSGPLVRPPRSHAKQGRSAGRSPHVGQLDSLTGLILRPSLKSRRFESLVR